mmetsp:Transcript_29253/g.62103  ORF Transcript_29253/g.62103 Transcript_29253/m.62103 type:complete len:209 (-) Transcript_29253:1279-1905(-)
MPLKVVDVAGGDHLGHNPLPVVATRDLLVHPHVVEHVQIVLDAQLAHLLEVEHGSLCQEAALVLRHFQLQLEGASFRSVCIRAREVGVKDLLLLNADALVQHFDEPPPVAERVRVEKNLVNDGHVEHSASGFVVLHQQQFFQEMRNRRDLVDYHGIPHGDLGAVGLPSVRERGIHVVHVGAVQGRIVIAIILCRFSVHPKSIVVHELR